MLENCSVIKMVGKLGTTMIHFQEIFDKLLSENSGSMGPEADACDQV
jgi:hypothetical protein